MKVYSIYKVEVNCHRLSASFPSLEELVDLAKVSLFYKGDLRIKLKKKYMLNSLSKKNTIDIANFLVRDSELYVTYDPCENFLLLGDMFVIAKSELDDKTGRVEPIEFEQLVFRKGEGIDDFQIRLY